jgi:hypothetical protein
MPAEQIHLLDNQPRASHAFAVDWEAIPAVIFRQLAEDEVSVIFDDEAKHVLPDDYVCITIGREFKHVHGGEVYLTQAKCAKMHFVGLQWRVDASAHQEGDGKVRAVW